jgi:hypothetical protein
MAMVGGTKQKVVVYPYGRPLSYPSTCDAMTLKLGGDLQRSIDQAFPTVEDFLSHAARVAVFRRQPLDAIFIFTMTNPLALRVLEGRRKIERAFPSSVSSIWAVLADLEENPFFFENATDLGALEGKKADVPVWTTKAGEQFLVLSSEVSRDTRVRTALRSAIASRRGLKAPGKAR